MLKLFFSFLLLVCTILSYSQTIIKDSPGYSLSDTHSSLFKVSSSRKIIELNKDWKVFKEVSGKDAITVSLPCTFENTEDLIFEKEFSLSNKTISEYNLVLHFLGINYHAEILLNEVVIYKKGIANIPFTLEVPNNLLSSQSNNLLTIKVTHVLDDESTLPPLQRFLFPKNSGGITRDVFLELVPKMSLVSLKINPEISNDYNSADIYLDVTLANSILIKDSSSDTYYANISLLKENIVVASTKENISQFASSTEAKVNTVIKIQNPDFWFPDKPHLYTCKVTLVRNDLILDEVTKEFAIYELKSVEPNFQLNKTEFELKGVTYVTPDYFQLDEPAYKLIGDELRLIKNTGFNSVRFIKSIPHPYALELCQEIGLLAFIELPLNSVPEEILDDPNYVSRVKEISELLTEYSQNYSSIAAIGVGSSFLANSISNKNFISKITGYIKNNFKGFIYASFVGVPDDNIESLDLVGIELYSIIPSGESNSRFKSIASKSSKYFLSEATYPHYDGSRSGYLSNFSYEAQAKFIEDVIDFSSRNNLSGFFLNSFFDYFGDYTSLYTKFNEDNNYSIGIIGKDKNQNVITYKVANSKLEKSERITIPIGSKSDDSPLFIILMGLGLAVFMGLLVNSKKKFRSDATRALLRPYNFFADIRDHRILSGFHTNLLMIVIAGAHALLITNLLFFLKNNILLEKLLLSFGYPTLLGIIGYLTWNPVSAFIYMLIFSIALFFIIAFIIKAASFFVKTRILFTNIYYVVIWSFLPLTILLPIKLVLYRVLTADVINIYIYIFLIFYLFWIISRLLKGVYVIFDVNKGLVYFYSALFFILIFGSVLLYFQLTNSTLYYIINSFKQYQLMYLGS